MPRATLTTLPIDAHLEDILRQVRAARAGVIVAAPGAGKTTRVPPALAADGPVLVLQPRRVAARAIAARIGAEQGWTLGDEVGWHVRFERRFSARTRVLLATEGILTARLLQDPLLSDFRTIVLDEFHERSLHADLGLALARQAWHARDDLRLVVMSATIDPRPVAAFLGDCPVIDVPGRQHPVPIDYAPGESLAQAVGHVLAWTSGTILCFLPGAPEIRREMSAIARVAPDVELLPLHGSLSAEEQDAAIQPPSSGSPAASLSSASSAPSLSHASPPAHRRRVILATNIAETSLTVPGVTAVIDTGLQKVARYDAARGIDSLDVERISQDSADQRAGRAGRLGPGIARRLWSAHDRLRPQREPDIGRVDLAATLLDLLAWGGDPDRFEWYEPPPRLAIDAAWTLLARLGAIRTREAEEGHAGATRSAGDAASPGATPVTRSLTPLGRALQRLPVHPRLGRILLAAQAAGRAGESRDAARACALLSERHYLAPRHEATTCDLLVAIDRWWDVPWHVQRVARDLEEVASRANASRANASRANAGRANAGGANAGRANTTEAQRDDLSSLHAAGERALRRALFAGYPDRIARRRAPGGPRVLLASGHGAVVSRESGVQEGEFLVALDVQAGAGSAGAAREAALRPGGPRIAGPRTSAARRTFSPSDAPAAEARIRLASVVDREWLTPTGTETAHWLDAESGRVRAARRDMYDEIVLAEHPVAPDPSAAARVLADAYLARGLGDADQQLIHRLRFAGRAADAADVSALVERACQSARSLHDVDLAGHLAHDDARELARLAPPTLPVPSGRTARLEYHEDGSVSAAVKLQELFGLAETPRIGARRTPVVLQLLAPNGRPVQTTRDLRSFWDRTYPEVRKELRGRYPKHPWPEDPWSATPTARTTRRSREG